MVGDSYRQPEVYSSTQCETSVTKATQKQDRSEISHVYIWTAFEMKMYLLKSGNLRLHQLDLQCTEKTFKKRRLLIFSLCKHLSC